jgi:hypothetical protein
MPNLVIRVFFDRTIGQTHIPGREALPIDAAAHLTQAPGIQPLADEMEFGFTHGAFESQQEPIIKEPRVVNPVVVGDQGAKDGGQVEQMIPVTVIAGKSRDLVAEDDADMAQRDLRNQILKALAIVAALTR